MTHAHDIHTDSVQPIVWQDDALYLIDQRLLPGQLRWNRYRTGPEAAAAIKDMVVRGAPAIGITAAFGVVMAARSAWAVSGDGWREAIEAELQILADSRPTAVNLFWALDRMRGLFPGIHDDPVPRLLAEARAIHEEDIAANKAMGDAGAALIEPGSGVLTHCNAGALATGGYGTALGVIRSAWTQQRLTQVYADETRPWLQGARLTAWELLEDHIPVSLLADGANAWLMKQGKIHWVVVGSDRIAANGDVANKIGTRAAAISARYHGVKFMVAAPTSTIDMGCPSGDDIPIETRAEEELLSAGGHRVAASGAGAWNPVFDVTPADLVDAIVTEKGVVLNPTAEKMRALMEC